MFSSISDTGDSSQTYDLLVTSPDALPLSYRRLVGAKAIKLGPCDKPSCILLALKCRKVVYS